MTNTFDIFRIILHYNTKTKKQKTIYVYHRNKIIIFNNIVIKTKTIARFFKKHNDVNFDQNNVYYLCAKRLM